MSSVFGRAFWPLAAAGLVYTLFMFTLTFPTVQKHGLYVHKVNPLKFPRPFRQSLDDFEKFGFLNQQVTPFTLMTDDSESISAFHILPLHLYHQHEKSLFLQADSEAGPYTDSNVSSAYPVRLLLNNPAAKVIINLHGNAGHAFIGYRPDLYRSLLSHSTPDAPIHLFTLDYRGFGLSSGDPSEEGVITDVLTLLRMLTSPPYSIAPENMVIIGQSLGTAIATGTAHAWAFNKTHFARPNRELTSLNLMLMASFTNVIDLLDSYRLFGLIPPVFSPLAPYPWAKRYFKSQVVLGWNTSARLEDLVGKEWKDGYLQLSIVHAKNDWDIPWLEGEGNWRAAMRGAGVSDLENQLHVLRMGKEKGHTLTEWRSDGVQDAGAVTKAGKGTKLVRWERGLYGQHFGIALQEWGRLAVKRLLLRM